VMRPAQCWSLSAQSATRSGRLKARTYCTDDFQVKERFGFECQLFSGRLCAATKKPGGFLLRCIHAEENHRWTQMNPARLAPQPQGMECGGKRSATPLSEAGPRSESGVAAALCHRTPNLCRPCAELHGCSTDSEG
jgi:hypothetical protein